LQIIAKRIIVNPDGEIIDHKLNSPFMYLWSIAEVFRDLDSSRRGSEQVHVGAQVLENRSTDKVEWFFSLIRFENSNNWLNLGWIFDSYCIMGYESS